MAAAVMVLAITTSITTMQHSFLAVDTARNITVAAQIMQSEFERMRLKDWATIDALDSGAVAIDSTYSTNTSVTSRFTLSRTVTVVKTGMKQITLTVSWRGYNGRILSRSYTTYYGRDGLYDYFYNTSS